jgi:hypothetical protein
MSAWGLDAAVADFDRDPAGFKRRVKQMAKHFANTAATMPPDNALLRALRERGCASDDPLKYGAASVVVHVPLVDKKPESLS